MWHRLGSSAGSACCHKLRCVSQPVAARQRAPRTCRAAAPRASRCIRSPPLHRAARAAAVGRALSASRRAPSRRARAANGVCSSRPWRARPARTRTRARRTRGARAAARRRAWRFTCRLPGQPVFRLARAVLCARRRALARAATLTAAASRRARARSWMASEDEDVDNDCDSEEFVPGAGRSNRHGSRRGGAKGKTIIQQKGGWTDEEDARLARCGARIPRAAARGRGETCTRRFIYPFGDADAVAAPARRGAAARLVEAHGDHKWSLVATLLGGRIGKQVRRRRAPGGRGPGRVLPPRGHLHMSRRPPPSSGPVTTVGAR